jgi:predicted nucleic acid-binding protein
VNVVDSSGWLEYLADGPNASWFAPAIEDVAQLVVPTISLYEVFKRMLLQRGEADALEAVATMRQGTVIELTDDLALQAAATSAELRLPMADSIMLTTARVLDATLWTQDADFEGLEGVQYVAKVQPWR